MSITWCITYNDTCGQHTAKHESWSILTLGIPDDSKQIPSLRAYVESIEFELLPCIVRCLMCVTCNLNIGYSIHLWRLCVLSCVAKHSRHCNGACVCWQGLISVSIILPVSVLKNYYMWLYSEYCIVEQYRQQSAWL